MKLGKNMQTGCGNYVTAMNNIFQFGRRDASFKKVKQCAVRWHPILLIGLVFSVTVLSACNKGIATAGKDVQISLNPDRTYQTITGWEAGAEIGQSDFPEQFNMWKDRVIDLAVNDLGINRLRLRVNSGTENPVDYFTPYSKGEKNRKYWRNHWFEIINDNDDPFVTDMSNYQFSALDDTIDNLILPMMRALETRGESLFINLLEVDFTCCKGYSNLKHKENPEEYAEFILAVFQHMKTKYGFVPDAVEVILEPDNAGWSGKQIGKNIVAAGNRLKSYGFEPAFIAPSNTNMRKAIKYFDDMVKVPGVLQYLKEISYHRYWGVSESNLQAIAYRAVRYGLNTSMLEHIGSDYRDLHDDLKTGRNSAWEQFTLAYPTSDNGAQYFTIDKSDASSPKVNMGARTKFLRQYFKYIRRGAVRIEATSDDDQLDPLAFINTDGRYVAVIKAESESAFKIRGLPGGTYGTRYTTSQQYDMSAPDVTIAQGEEFNGMIPMKGVITVYGKK